jgi:hypothetical protein
MFKAYECALRARIHIKKLEEVISYISIHMNCRESGAKCSDRQMWQVYNHI